MKIYDFKYLMGLMSIIVMINFGLTQELTGSGEQEKVDNNKPVTHGELKEIMYVWWQAADPRFNVNEYWNEKMANTNFQPLVHGVPLNEQTIGIMLQSVNPFAMMATPSGGYDDRNLKKQIEDLKKQVQRLNTDLNAIVKKNPNLLR